MTGRYDVRELVRVQLRYALESDGFERDDRVAEEVFMSGCHGFGCPPARRRCLRLGRTGPDSSCRALGEVSPRCKVWILDQSLASSQCSILVFLGSSGTDRFRRGATLRYLFTYSSHSSVSHLGTSTHSILLVDSRSYPFNFRTSRGANLASGFDWKSNADGWPLAPP